jgi:hypothetical protein
LGFPTAIVPGSEKLQACYEGKKHYVSRHISAWDQTLTLIWFEDEAIRPEAPERRLTYENDGLSELDGTLPWPGGKKRRP